MSEGKKRIKKIIGIAGAVLGDGIRLFKNCGSKKER